MWKFVIIGVALFLIYKLFTGDKKKQEMEQKETVKQKVAAGEMVKDPVCGTYVEKDGDIRVREGEKVRVFCSYECRDRYLKQIEAITVEPEEAKKED